LVNIFNATWYVRNQSRFNGNDIASRSRASIITINVSFYENNFENSANLFVYDFSILKSFKVDINPPRASIIKEIIWSPPMFSWVKCNTNGATFGCLGVSSYSGASSEIVMLIL
jgi:hypothetical protein